MADEPPGVEPAPAARGAGTPGTPAQRVPGPSWAAGAPVEQAPGPAQGPDAVAALRQEVERLTGLVAEKDRMARESAVRAQHRAEELERAKERIRKDAGRELRQRTRDVVLGFIEVLDDLDRAVASARDSDGAAGVVAGVELVRRRFLDKLSQHGVAHAPALGARFDPALHEAVSLAPVTDPSRDGVVIGVVREGYRAGDELLRAARVVVGKAL